MFGQTSECIDVWSAKSEIRSLDEAARLCSGGVSVKFLEFIMSKPEIRTL